MNAAIMAATMMKLQPFFEARKASALPSGTKNGLSGRNVGSERGSAVQAISTSPTMMLARADRHHENRNGAFADQPPKDEALEESADRACGNQRQDNGRPIRQRCLRGKAEKEVGPDHHEFADGEIDDPRRFVDEDKTNAGQCVQRADGQARQAEFDKIEKCRVHDAAASTTASRTSLPISPLPR